MLAGPPKGPLQALPRQVLIAQPLVIGSIEGTDRIKTLKALQSSFTISI